MISDLSALLCRISSATAGATLEIPSALCSCAARGALAPSDGEATEVVTSRPPSALCSCAARGAQAPNNGEDEGPCSESVASSAPFSMVRVMAGLLKQMAGNVNYLEHVAAYPP